MKTKVTIFLLFIVLGLKSQSILDIRIDREYEEEPLSYMLSNISDKYDVAIKFNEAILPSDRFTYSFKEIALNDVLRILLNDKGLHFKEYEKDKLIIVPSYMVEADSLLTSTTVTLDEQLLPSTTLGKSTNEKTVKIVGSIIDSRDFSAVSNVLVINNSMGSYLSTDASGNFSMTIDTGVYTFQFNSIAHKPYKLTVHIVGSDVWEVLLEAKAHLLNEVVISGSSSQDKSTETIIGLEQLSRKEIKQLSFLMGEADVVKSVLSLAGVSTTGDGASGFNVRGGSIDQNLIIQDGTIIFNPSHVLGFFSIFNPDIVRNTTLVKGHMPAYYGGRVSSVLDVKIRDANTDYISTNGSIGLISSKASLDIPIVKHKSSLLLSGRKSYAGWLLDQVENFDVRNSSAEFNDYNIKYSHNITNKTKASLSYFQSFDKFAFTDEFGYSWQNKVGQLALRHIINDNLSLSAMTSISSLNNQQFQPEGVFAFELSSGVKYNQANIHAIYAKGNHEIRTGIEFVGYEMKPETLEPLNESNTLSKIINKEKGREYSIFINDQYDLTDKISLDFGLRFTSYQQLGPHTANIYNSNNNIAIDEVVGTTDYGNEQVIAYSGLEPRVALRFNLFEKFALRASYNRTNQYLQLLSNTVTPTPVDIWQVSTSYIKPLRSDNFSAGIAHTIGSIDYNIDLYYKKLENTLDYRDFAKLILNNNLETETLLGRGRNYGMELSIDKKGEFFSGKFSYSFSRSMHQVYDGQNATINRGEWFSANFDQPHSLKLFLNVVASKRDRFNVNFTYNTGRPITAPFGTYIVNGAVVSNFSDRNQFRLPSYHRLDLGYTFSLNRRKSVRYKSDLTISFYNFYGRKNAFSIFYRQETGSPINALKLSVIGTIIPSISYNFQF